MELSVIIPALNEEKTIKICIHKALNAMKCLHIESGEIIVADNGSTDGTISIAEALGARIVKIDLKGYGNALMGGFGAAKGNYLLMGDADDSYNFEEIVPFLEKLREGYDFVMGNRFLGRIEKGAMPFLHRYLGTPVLTGLMNLFFRTGIGDTNCGMRALTKSAFEKMCLKAGGMEFATEMVVKASLLHLKIAQVPCNLYKDKRDRKPHLKTWRDGWMHLRFLLLFTPTWTFLIPGFVLAGIGAIGMLTLFLRDVLVAGYLPFITQKHMLSAMLVLLTGFQIIQSGVIARAFSFHKLFDQESRTMRFLKKRFTLEKGVLSGGSMVFVSVLTFLYLFASYYTGLLPKFTDCVRIDIAMFAAAFFIAGVQTIFSSFVLSLFYLDVK